MDAQQIGVAFGRAVQWAGLLGLGGVALAALALSLARLRRSFRACPPLRRTLAVLAVAAAVAYAGTKPEATVGSSTNRHESTRMGETGEVVRSKDEVVSAEDSSSAVAADGTQQDADHHTCSLLPATYSLTKGDFARGFVLARVGAGEAFDFDAPTGATVCADWRLFGAAEDWAYLAFTNWSFRAGTNEASRLRVRSDGRVEPLVPGAGGAAARAFWFAPLQASLGLAPEASWPLVAGNGGTAAPGGPAPSRFWHLLTPSNTLRLTWQNALLGRRASAPVSFQAELWPSGRFAFRYGLPRPDADAASNALVGASLGGPAWTTNALPADVTSLAFHPLSAADAADPDRDGDGLSLADELFVHGTDPDMWDSDGDGLSDGEEVARRTNPLVRDTDGDGLPDGSDPDPLVPTPPDDLDGDGLPDAYEDFWFGGTNVVDDAAARDGTGFALAAKLLFGMDPTNAAPAAVADGPVVSWRLFGGFAADWPADATDLVWERTFAVDRSSAWRQLFVSASPAAAAPWRLEGMALEWETDTGIRGSAAASPCADSLRIPLAAGDRLSSLTLRLRASGGPAVRAPAPLHLVAYEPEFRVTGGREVTGLSGRTFLVFEGGPDARIALAVDESRRPHRAPPGDGERDAAAFAAFAAQCGGGSFDGGASGGTVRPGRPCVCPLPDFARGESAAARPARRRAARAVEGPTVVVLDPSVGWRCDGHGCGHDGLGYDWQSGRYAVEDGYPLDTRCLCKKWYRDWGGGWRHDRCELVASSGLGDGSGWVTASADGNKGTVYVDGVAVWSGTAEHVYDDTGCGGLYEEALDDGCDGCDGDCADGNCDALEGPSLGSLKFRVPLGAPVKGQVAGFAWFSTDGPVSVSRSTFRLLAHPDAHVSDTDDGAARRIACSDPRGRDLRIADVADGVRVTVLAAAARTLEHTWEIANVDGDPARIRLRKVSRLGNVMSDETYACADGDWTRADNVSGAETRLESSGDLGAGGTGWETRTTTDAAGNVLASVTVERSRIGACDNAVLRETYRSESTGADRKWSRADWWNDPAHSARHGRLRLLTGNARAWEYRDYDELGHETLSVSQRNGSAVPASFPSVVSNGLAGADGLADAFVTVRGFAPLPGDSGHPDDAAKPRAETRYVVTDGAATVIGHTWTRYTRLVRDGYAAIKAETWRAASPDAAFGDAGNAYSYEITYADTGEGTPLLMRNAVAASLDEDGVLTANAHSLSGGVLSRTSRRSRSSRPFPTYETTETDATHGTVLRRTTRLTSGDAVIADERSAYDSKNRLRSTVYLDGTSLTNAYSCCRLLWRRGREGRRTLRSAKTGTDHLYRATEDVWLADVSTNGQYRVTQRLFDALGRETNMVVYAGATPGEAEIASASEGKALSRAATEYPFGGSDYAVRTDARGKVTVTERTLPGDAEATTEIVLTNGVEVLRTTTRAVFGGGSSVRREWTAAGADGRPVPAWTEERRLTGYAADGRRIDYVVTESSDCGTVTNSVAVCDLLGREAVRRVPGADGGWIVTSNAYDGASSRLLSSTAAAGGVSRTTTFLYDACGQPVGMVADGVTNHTDVAYETDDSGVTWRVETSARTAGSVTNALSVTRTQLTGLSDARRRHVVEVSGVPGGPQTSTEAVAAFDPASGVETETISSSVAPATVTRRRHGLALETARPGETVATSYDALGREAATSRSVGGAVATPVREFSYSPCGDLLATRTWTNATVSVAETYAYDMLGNRVAATDALGNAVHNAYDPLGNVAAEWGAAYPVRRTYDTQGRRTSLTTTRDGISCDVTSWDYDLRTGGCASKTYADGSVVTYTYTPDNLLLRTTYASGRWIENVYDARRQVIGTVSCDGSADAAFAHDAGGRLVAASNAAASVALSLSDGGAATNEAWTVGGASAALVRTFDPQGRLASLLIPGRGYGLAFAYDADGRLASVSSAVAAVTYAYTPDGLDAGYTLTLADGATFTRAVTRDPFRRELAARVESGVNGVPVERLDYAHDALGRPVSRNADSFAYNARGEVATAMAVGGLPSPVSATYAYDLIGNATLAAHGSLTNAYSANSLNQYTSVLRVSAPPREIHPQHDADGNLVLLGPWACAYDAANRLVSVSSNGAPFVANAYDWKGRRVRKATPDATYTFFYDGWDLVEERIAYADGTASTIHYYWGKDVSGTLQGAGGIGGLLYLTVDDAPFVPCYDSNGNVTRYLDASGRTVAEYVYAAFGGTISASGPLADAFRFRFSTKYHDAETGLYYYGYRFYSPVLRRWLTRDPIGEGGLNLYGFCGNNAVANYDKDGRAYFAYRTLDNPATHRTGIVAASLGVAQKRNWVVAHEQLIFEDGGSPINIGYFDAPIGAKNPRQDEFHFQTQYVPIEGKGAYNDCVMREAVKNVQPRPYKLWTLAGRSTGQYNCQDYADDLRSEYYKLLLDIKIRCKCGLK